MEVRIDLSKYDILVMASMIGASEENLEKIEKYINENDYVKVDFFVKEDDGYAEYKTAMAATAVAQISLDLNLK